MYRILVVLMFISLSVTAVSASTAKRCIAVSADHQIYLTDSETCRVWRLDKEGNVKSSWGGKGTGKGMFLYPSGVATDSKGNVYICDSRLNLVQIFDASGRYIGEWNLDTTNGSAGMSPVAGIALNIKGDVYAACAGKEPVKVFSSDGKLLHVMGKQGMDKSEFLLPASLVVDPSDNVYVADVFRNDLQKMSASGEYVAGWSCKPKKPKQVCVPISLSVDSTGDVYVLATISSVRIREPGHVTVYDRVENTIQKFTPDGKLISESTADTTSEALAVDSVGVIYTVGLQDKKLVVRIYSKDGKPVSKIVIPR